MRTGELIAAFEAREMRDEASAIRTGKEMARRHVGGVTWTRTADLINGVFSSQSCCFKTATCRSWGDFRWARAVADHPAAASLGHSLFFDIRPSGNGQVACASCHLPEQEFQDGLPLANGMGRTNRRTMPIAGTAYSPWLFWDGRKDSQWSQALGPLESAVEHGADRTQIARVVATNYSDAYGSIFGPLPALGALPDHAGPRGDAEAQIAWQNLDAVQRDTIDRIFANVGKAIAAFERTIVPQRTRFDLYADAVPAGTDTASLFSESETKGLRLFIGKGECTKCHNGALMTDNYFHNTGVPPVSGLPDDSGRAAAIERVVADPFNCLGKYSDADPGDCTELAYIDNSSDGMVRAYKSPSLRGVAGRPPYMHAGQICSLHDVLRHYETAPAAVAGHSELNPLDMTEKELAALEASLKTLSPISSAGAVP